MSLAHFLISEFLVRKATLPSHQRMTLSLWVIVQPDLAHCRQGSSYSCWSFGVQGDLDGEDNARKKHVWALLCSQQLFFPPKLSVRNKLPCLPLLPDTHTTTTNPGRASCLLEHNPKAGSSLLLNRRDWIICLPLLGPPQAPLQLSLNHQHTQSFSQEGNRSCACLPCGAASPSWMWLSQKNKWMQFSPSTWPTHFAWICTAGT